MNYDNLDVRINLLYDVVYNTNNSKHYTIKPIILDNITLEDIKKTTEFASTNEFEQIFTDGVFKYKEKINNKWIFKRDSDSSYSSIVSIGKYDLSEIKNPNDLKRKELNNALMHYILSEVVINDKFKHVMLPLMMVDVSLDDLTKSNDIYDVVNKKNKNSNGDSKYYMFITEGYYKLTPLKTFLEEKYDEMNLIDWKVLIFQVLYALYKISERLPAFRHNMLNLDAIRLYIKDSKDNNIYHVGSNKFNIPNVGFDVKITDFENASTNQINPRELKENPFYDIYYFLISLYLFIKSKVVNSKTKPIIDFIEKIIPNSLIPESQSDIMNTINEQLIEQKMEQILSPIMILNKNNFFKQFISTMSLSPEPIDNKHINKDELNKKYSGVNYYSATDDNSDMPRMLARKSASTSSKVEYRGKRKSIDLSKKSYNKFYGDSRNKEETEDDEDLDLSDVYSDDEDNTEQPTENESEENETEEPTEESEEEEKPKKKSILKRAEKRYREISRTSDDVEYGRTHRNNDDDDSESYFNENDVKEMRKYLRDSVEESPQIKAKKQDKTKSRNRQVREKSISSSSIDTEDLMKSIKRIHKPSQNNNQNYKTTGFNMPYDHPMNNMMNNMMNSPMAPSMNPYMNTAMHPSMPSMSPNMNMINSPMAPSMSPTMPSMPSMSSIMPPVMPQNAMNMTNMTNNDIMSSLMPPIMPQNTMNMANNDIMSSLMPPVIQSNMSSGIPNVSETMNFMTGGAKKNKQRFTFVKDDNKEVKPNKDFFFQPSQEVRGK